MTKKTCSRCKQEKPLDMFQRRVASVDFLTAACKACLAEYDKRRANLPHRVEAREKYASSPAGRLSGARAKSAYIKRNFRKRRAHIAVGNAIRDGKLTKCPCEVCGSHDVHAHHDDYSKPLNVRWLCPVHHKQWHDQNGEALNS